MSLKGSSDSIYSNNVKIDNFWKWSKYRKKTISSSWAHWLYIHLVSEWYTEWPFHSDLDPFHSFSDRVNIDYKGQCFRAIQGNLPKCPPDEKGSAGWNEVQLVTKRWFVSCYQYTGWFVLVCSQKIMNNLQIGKCSTNRITIYIDLRLP